MPKKFKLSNWVRKLLVMREFALISSYWSIWLSAIVFVCVYVFLNKQLLNNCDFRYSLAGVTTDLLTVSGIITAIIMAYLTSKVLQIRHEKINRLNEYNELTQKVHRYRAILNRLKHSAVGSGNGNSRILQKEFENMIPKSMRDDDLYSDFDRPKYYSQKFVEQWIDNDCGNGLWSHFDEYLDDIKSNALDSLSERDKGIIIAYCMRIDETRYKSMEFGPNLLAKLGTQFFADIFPRLYGLQLRFKKKLPKVINYLYVILCLLIIFGILFPLLIRLFGPNPRMEIISLSVIIAVCVNIIFSFYAFLKNEIKIDLRDFF